MGPRAGLDGRKISSPPGFDPGPSSPLSVGIPTELPGVGYLPVPILQEAGWAPGPVWTGGKSRPHRDLIPDRPARSQSAYRLSYPAQGTYRYLPNMKFNVPQNGSGR